MLRVGITGQAGFLGSHLFNYLGLCEGIERIPFEHSFFEDGATLRSFVKQCDAIVHLAAMNRHNDPETLHKTNIDLVQQLIDAMEAECVTPHVLFSSSTQEERDNRYGQSKKEGRHRFIAWAERWHALFSGLIIPNVFGPFGHPYYNSVIATFSHQLTHGETPRIDVDGTLQLIYAGELVPQIHRMIVDKQASGAYAIPPTAEISVTHILALLRRFRADYFEQGILPSLNNEFEKNLFNTFRSYIDQESFFPRMLTRHADERGSFVETVKLHLGGQVSFSTTRPGITRGDHFHTRKIERFVVIKGKARIELRKIGTDKVLSFDLDGDKPAFVDMPVWYTHNITNTGAEELFTLFWINEFFDPADPDTFFVKVNPVNR